MSKNGIAQPADTALLAEMQSLRKDAERYRWLRQQRHITDHACVTWNIGHDWVQMDGVELDAAIDYILHNGEDGISAHEGVAR